MIPPPIQSWGLVSNLSNKLLPCAESFLWWPLKLTQVWWETFKHGNITSPACFLQECFFGKLYTHFQFPLKHRTKYPLKLQSLQPIFDKKHMAIISLFSNIIYGWIDFFYLTEKKSLLFLLFPSNLAGKTQQKLLPAAARSCEPAMMIVPIVIYNWMVEEFLINQWLSQYIP